MSKLVRFSIINLWKEKNVSLCFNDNRLILVGENGSGKTTILRILYETLAGEFNLLKTEDFEKIILEFEKDKIEFSKDDIPNPPDLFELFPRLIDDLPSFIKRKYIDYRDSLGMAMPINELITQLEEFGYPRNETYKQLLDKAEQLVDSAMLEIKNRIKENLDCNLLYLPTYRRAEKRNSARKERHRSSSRTFVYDDNSPEPSFRAIEITRTGMTDVERFIEQAINNIKIESNISASRLNYQCFKGILTKESERVRYDNQILSKDNIENVFGSINESLLSMEESAQIKELLIAMEAPQKQSYEQIVYYFYSLLYQRYVDLKEKEKTILRFFEACNQYLYNKKFVYDEKEFDYSILVTEANSNRELNLEDLSSGEKQVVAIFSYLYLSPLSKSLVLIDEPELSLSVPWQKRILLDISKGQQCAGVISVTHSPFVYDNELRKYAHSLEEFIKQS